MLCIKYCFTSSRRALKSPNIKLRTSVLLSWGGTHLGMRSYISQLFYAIRFRLRFNVSKYISRRNLPGRKTEIINLVYIIKFIKSILYYNYEKNFDIEIFELYTLLLCHVKFKTSKSMMHQTTILNNTF
jgi:hypothetical protein